MGERRTYMPEGFQCLEVPGQSGLGNPSAQEFPRWTGHFRAGQAARQVVASLESHPAEVCALAPPREFRKAKEWSRGPWEVAEAAGSPCSLAGSSKALKSAMPLQK